jgi:hypothetical protein
MYRTSSRRTQFAKTRTTRGFSQATLVDVAQRREVRGLQASGAFLADAATLSDPGGAGLPRSAPPGEKVTLTTRAAAHRNVGRA